ncbi:hypothetical protein AB1M95_11560 [Sulfitobacter sp. LCG007]
MAKRFSLKDHLFNAETLGQLAREYAAALPDFDAARFEAEALSGLAELGLLERLELIADCIEAQLPQDFPAMAEALEAAMPEPLDPGLGDDDFGHFIRAVPGILAVRHGLEAHRERALDLIHAATRRFSMEFYIRPFLNRWPAETLERLALWAGDPNYHVRRLVSEGTRPRLPWARAVALSAKDTLPLLDRLHADPTRYVTRSVANHLNDLTRSVPEAVIARLEDWRGADRQDAAEMSWIARHALRSLIKQGHAGAMRHLGFDADAPVEVALDLAPGRFAIGENLSFSCELLSGTALPVLVDYRIRFARPGGRSAEKVFKLRRAELSPGVPLVLRKRHALKADATTFTLHPGPHRLTLQINGIDRAAAVFELV